MQEELDAAAAERRRKAAAAEAAYRAAKVWRGAPLVTQQSVCPLSPSPPGLNFRKRPSRRPPFAMQGDSESKFKAAVQSKSSDSFRAPAGDSDVRIHFTHG